MPGKSVVRSGRIALVTGGGTGIGRGIALALARRGYSVALVGRRVERLREVAGLVERLGGRAIVFGVDLSNAGELAGVVERVRLELGPIDLLVNNAGVMMGGNLGSLAADEVARGIFTNLVAPIELTRQALSDLTERGGTVVFVGSTMSFLPMPSASVYSAGKAGIRAVVESLRYELEPAGVRVVLAYPPPTDTAMTRGMGKRSGALGFPRRRPDVVGEELVRGVVSGKKEVIFGMDRGLRLLHRVFPGLVRVVFRSQRRRFERMMEERR